jgi:hypothetical protein
MELFQWLTDNYYQPHICQLLLIILLLQCHNSIHNCHYLHCLAILSSECSPWKKFYENANAESFLYMICLTRGAFASLLDYLFDLEDIVYHCRGGRPLSLSPDGYLRLLLFYLGSKMQYRHLCHIFGITPSIGGRAINMMLRRTAGLLWGHPMARVQFPDEVKMMEFATMIQQREPMVDIIMGFMDRLLFPVQCTDERINCNNCN